MPYTSTTLYILATPRLGDPHIVGLCTDCLCALARGLSLQTGDSWLTATFALLAGLFPAVFEALKLDTHVDSIARQAAVFKNLQDRFRLLATVRSLGLYETFDAEFREAMGRMEEARATSITPPERCFKAARKKIAAGHYSFDIDHADATGQ